MSRFLYIKRIANHLEFWQEHTAKLTSIPHLSDDAPPVIIRFNETLYQFEKLNDSTAKWEKV